MYQVVVLPPPDALGQVEHFRRLHDPGFHRSAAHIVLLPPFEALRADFLERIVELRLGPPLIVRLGPPIVEGHALQLPVTHAGPELEAFRDTIADALLDPAADRPRVPLGLRVGLISSEAELELARRTLAAESPLPPFEVTSLALLLEDERGMWHVVRELQLAD